MATNFLWGAVGTTMNLLTTELNSLATGSGTAYGPEINNSSGYQLGQLTIHLASNSSAFTTASYVSVFLVPSTDTAGTAYPTYTSGSSYKLSEQNYLVATIAINPATQSANVVDETVPYVPIPLGKFKCILVNQSGVTLPASGNTVNLYPTPSQY